MAFDEDLQQQFHDLLHELSTLRREKVGAYGDERYRITDVERSLLLVYSDLYRKSLRLWELCQSAPHDEDAAWVLRDNLMDLASYALMGVQIIDLFGLWKKERKDGV